MTTSTSLPKLRASPEDGLGRYLRQIRTYPLLTADDERRLAEDYAESGNPAARDRLITSHLRFVAKIASGYRGYGLPMAELMSAGNEGLMQAVDKFDPERGFRLSTYAMWWIRASMQEYILQAWSIVRMGSTSHQKKLFFNLRRLKGHLRAFEEGDLNPETVQEIADTLRVPETDVINMNRRMAGHDHSLNAPLREEGEGQWQDWLVDDAADPEARVAEQDERAHQRRLLGDAMTTLTERERSIVTERRLSENPPTLEQLSYRYGISRERVRQIEGIALDKLKKFVGAAAAGLEEDVQPGGLAPFANGEARAA